MFYEMPITPHHAGFGMWQAGEANGEGWAHESDLIAEACLQLNEEIVELGRDDLPEGIEDIRGKIYGEPARIFAYLQEEHGASFARYYGIVERD